MNQAEIQSASEQAKLLRDFLNSALREMMSLVNAECGSLFIFDPERKELVLDAFLNSCQIPIDGLSLKLGEGVSGKVIGMSSPVLVKNIEHDSRFKSNGFKHYHTKSFMCLPLEGTQGLLGVINLADKANGKSFTEDDLKKASIFTRYVYRISYDILHMATLKNAQSTLQRYNALAEKYASIGKITSGVLHEINSPLDGILRYANILLAQADTDSVSRTYILNIKKGLHRIMNITKSVLEFSHSCRAYQDTQNRYAVVHELIDDALDMLKERIKPGITVTRRYDAGVYQVADFGIQHIFLNLIKNAFDAMPDGGELAISTRRTNDGTEITFKDTGEGIPDEVKNRIFEPFFTTKAVEQGTGLGLAICKEIIEKYNGRIRVESTPHEGTAFILSIPQMYVK